MQIKGFIGIVFGKNVLQRIIWFLCALSTLYLLRLNQYGALLDTEVYRSAGEQIVNGQNPYTTGYRSGSLGALAIYLVSKLSSINIMEYVFGFLNLAGIFIFVKSFITSKSEELLPVAALVLLWSSPVREMLLNHQITGICLGLFAIYQLGINVEKSPISIKAVSCIALAIACDLKPQLILPFLLVSLAKSRKYYAPFAAACLVVISNVLLSAHTQVFLFREQLDVILQLNTSSSNVKWRDISNIWTVIDFYIPAYDFWRIFAYLVTGILLLLIPIATVIRGESVGKFIAVIFPVFSIYCHTYDLIPLVALSLIAIFNSGINRLNLLMIFLMLIPFRFLDIENNIFLLLFAILIIVSNKTDRANFANGIKVIFFAACAYFGIGAMLGLLSQNQQQINARIVCLIFLSSITAILSNKKSQEINSQ